MIDAARSSTTRVLVLVGLAVLAGACGGSRDEDAAPAAQTRPQVATGAAGSEAAPVVQRADGRQEPKPTRTGSEAPGYRQLVEDQSERPAERFTPCNLVTKAQAEAIMGRPIREPVEAPQGPSCIYRSITGGRFVTVAVQRAGFRALTSPLRRLRRVEVASRRAYCAMNGLPTLYVPVADGRVLTIAGPCAMATRFAARAAPRLPSS